MSAARSTPGIGLSGHGAISTSVLTWSEALSWSDCVDRSEESLPTTWQAGSSGGGKGRGHLSCVRWWALDTPKSQLSPGDAAREMRAANGGENGGNGRVTASDRAADGGRRAASDTVKGLSPRPLPHAFMLGWVAVPGSRARA